LSAIAGVFRRFFFKRLRFHLFGIQGSTQSGYAAMTSIITDDLGTIATPTTEAQILNSESVALCRPWSFTTHDVDLAGQGLSWYSTDTSASGTEFGEAPGLAYLAISQTTNANDIQIQLYVEYECEVCMRSAATLVPELSLFGGLVTGGGTVVASNLLGTTPTVDADAANILATSGVIAFRRNQTAVMSVNVAGTALTAINTPAGWTLLSATTSSTSASAVFAKLVTAGEASGVLSMPSGTPTSSTVVVSSVPPLSVTVSEPMPVLRTLHEPRIKYLHI